MALTPMYASRREVKNALDSGDTARDNMLVDQAIAAATQDIESPNLTRRRWYPWTGTRSYDWPAVNRSAYYSLELPSLKEIISLTSLTFGGTVIASSDYHLEPDERDNRAGATEIQIDLSSSAAFYGGSAGHQRAGVAVGVFGSWIDERAITTLNEALDATEVVIDVDSGAGISVGDLIRIDSERMIITAESMMDTAQDIGANLTASMAGQSVAVTDGTLFATGEIILVDAERMLIVDISGNTLLVKRAVDGTALASHASGAGISAVRAFTVERGSVGTTAAVHADNSAVYRHYPPDLIRQLARAKAIYSRLQEGAGWARPIGSGEQIRQVNESGIRSLEEDVRIAHGPAYRSAAI